MKNFIWIQFGKEWAKHKIWKSEWEIDLIWWFVRSFVTCVENFPAAFETAFYDGAACSFATRNGWPKWDLCVWDQSKNDKRKINPINCHNKNANSQMEIVTDLFLNRH